MKIYKGLQKFTKMSKIDTLLKKAIITKSEFDELTNSEKNEFFKIFTQMYNEYKGDEKDELVLKVDNIISDDTKNQFWENNHFQICQAMTKLIEDTGKMPAKNQIAVETGLSRQTIHKHLNNFANNPLYTDQINQFRFMADRVLAKVIKMAVKDEGNVKAARLYFEIMGNLGNKPGVKINTQKNYIQINGFIIRQDKIQDLKPEQIKVIENILKDAKSDD